MDEDAFEIVLKHHQRHGDLVLVSSSHIPNCPEAGDVDEMCKRLKCSRLASYDAISSTDFRIPLVKMLKGDNPWVIHIDNGVKYKFNVTRNMFSMGNITEKIRVSNMNCTGETIIDMFCGIGYFTLQFLVNTEVNLVHAIDWNPEAIECLKQNLLINKIAGSKCIIHLGDNNEVTPHNVADRVYLGLIPTSRFSWKTACKALKSSSGGVLHLHENVSIKELKAPAVNLNQPSISYESCSRIMIEPTTTTTKPTSIMKQKMLKLWEESVVKVIEEMVKEIHVNESWTVTSLGWHKVKSFAPGILHMVIDVDCRPCR